MMSMLVSAAFVQYNVSVEVTISKWQNNKHTDTGRENALSLIEYHMARKHN